MELRCEVCKQWVAVVFNPVACMSGHCIAIGNQSCMKFIKVPVPIPHVIPDILLDF